MTRLRPLPIIGIYLVASLAWFGLGSSVVARSGTFDDRLSQEVARLWGGPQSQAAPELWWEVQKPVTEDVKGVDAAGRSVTTTVTRLGTEHVPLTLESTRADVGLTLDHRRKGLLWYATYGVRFRASYRSHNTSGQEQLVTAHVTFPSEEVQFDNFVFRMNGRDAERTPDSKGATVRTRVAADATIAIELAYDSRGLDTWSYTFGPRGVVEVRDFGLTLRTDFDALDFPAGSMSPSDNQRTPGGRDLTWRFDHLLTGRFIGLALPNLPNPGPLAARITYFAPVSLLFFLTVMITLGVLREQSLHYMHYVFLSAAFFAFHLLLAYLVDHVSIHAAFAIASATSILLVTSYLRIVTGAHFAIARAGLAQLVFLVLFSYAFFFEGYTGLTVTVGAVLTLCALMQATAHVDWARVMNGQAEREGGAS
jgi:hypothetical protein